LSESEKSWVHKLFFNAYFEDALAKYRAQTGFGESYAILNALNEFWFQIGVMSREGYEYNKKRYGMSLTEKLKKEIETQEKAQQPQKPVVAWKPKPRPDYSKMSLEELEKRLNHLREAGETTETQFVAYEIKKRLAEKGVS
jgi:hypothetical protein